jgi:hypothetical protein
MKMKSFFTKIGLVVFLLVSANSFAQTKSTELRFLDEDAGNIYAGLRFTGMDKTGFDHVIEKINALKMYTVSNVEYTDGKQIGLFTLKSNSNSTVLDFQAFVKQLEIASLIYKGKTISPQEISSNYTPLEKSEISNKTRR